MTKMKVDYHDSLCRLLLPAMLLALLLVFAGPACRDRSSGTRTKPLIDLQPCPPGEPPEGLAAEVDGRCGVFEVYENRETKTGAVIRLRVAVIPALSRHSKPDPLFILAGGPGQAATEVGPLLLPFLKNVKVDRDIVLIDQRGTGSSGPLDCDFETEEDLLFQDPDPDLVEQCLAELKKGADLRRYTTPLAVDDLDEVRAALGYEKINLYGGSYGTRVALVYLRRHPERIRSVVLDGVAPTDLKLPLYLAVDGGRAMELMLSACEENPTCQTTFPNLRREWNELSVRLKETPAVVGLRHPRTGEAVTATINQEALAGTVFAALYNAELTSLLPLAIHAAREGDFQPLAAISNTLGGSAENMSFGMHLAVLCNEDLPRVTAEDIAQIRQSPFMADSRLQLYRQFCSSVPRVELPAAYYEPVHSAIPVLALSGEIDPVTPPRWGEAVCGNLSHCRHLIVPGTGHGVIAQGCMPQIIHRFLETADPAAVDSACLERQNRPPFFINPSGSRARGEP